MRRRIPIIATLVFVSLALMAAVFGREALAAFFDLQPHGCGGG